jgi:hypothetical protein
MTYRAIHVVRRPVGGHTVLLGVAVESEPGRWRFLPNMLGRMASRHFHPTFEACLPRWVGYPDSCDWGDCTRTFPVAKTGAAGQHAGPTAVQVREAKRSLPLIEE